MMFKILGIFLLALPSVAITVLAIRKVGIRDVLFAWGVCILVLVITFVGIWLISI
jgi:hypothetical protein